MLYYLRPIPDLFQALRGAEVVPVPRPVRTGVVVAVLAVVVLGVFPGIGWMLARGG